MSFIIEMMVFRIIISCEREREGGVGGGIEFWVVLSLFDFIYGWKGGCAINSDLQYVAFFRPAPGFQPRRLLV